jgi:putative transposase
MPRILDRLWLLLAAATDRKLTRMVEYLKAENRILRDRLPDKIVVTPTEKRRLLRYGAPLGAAIRDLITVVHPRTFLRWLAGDKPTAKSRATSREPGRPRTAEDVRQLVLRLAKETGWGYTRILGELKKLGVRGVCRSTVVNILKDAGLDPSPERRKGTWREFIRRHAATLWASDFVGVNATGPTLPRHGFPCDLRPFCLPDPATQVDAFAATEHA